MRIVFASLKSYFYYCWQIWVIGIITQHPIVSFTKETHNRNEKIVNDEIIFVQGQGAKASAFDTFYKKGYLPSDKST